MGKKAFKRRLDKIQKEHEKLITKKNKKVQPGNGIYYRYKRPVLTAEHAPLHWRYDLNYATNPFLMERIGVNAAMNSGAIMLNNTFNLVVRVEGNDRKSFFAVAESKNGIDNWRFREKPVALPQTEEPDVNVYDMRLTAHEDGWIYGIFCTERKDTSVPASDTSAATAQAGIVRTKDLDSWERLPDLKHKGEQQRNVVLHPEFYQGKYAFYTRPQDGFIDAGTGGGIGWALSDTMESPEIGDETIIDERVYHTIKEVKNGQGPAPIKTDRGWLHIAHGVRGCAAGLRYTLYMFMTSLEDPTKVIARPGGHFMGPQGIERVGDVSNVLFVNGWIRTNTDKVYIYYASSDTRMHVATSTVDRLVDYCLHTPEDLNHSHLSVQQRIELIDRNLQIKH